MAYQKTNWVNGYTPLNASNMNKIEEGIFNNDTFLSSLDIRVEDLENSIGQGGIGSVVVSGNGNALNNASYNPSTKILNFEKNNTFALDSDLDSVNDKNLYHLGAYDSVSGNTITRQTGYLVINGTENWEVWAGSTNAFRISYPKQDIPTNTNGYTQIPSFRVITNYLILRAPSSINSGENGITFGNNWRQIIIHINNITSISDLKNYLYEHPLIIHYQSTISYTEEIIEDRPLNTLDQSGSQWVREEWEKGLNLWSNGNISSNVTYSQNLPAGTYTYSFILNASTPQGTVIKIGNTNIVSESISTGYHSYTFITNGGTLTHLQYGGNSSQVMLNEGSHAYPYQQYQGGIVRESQAVKVKTFSGNTSTFNDFKTWMEQNSNNVISVIYYDYSSGNAYSKNVIFNIDSDVYKYINSEGSFDNVALADSSVNEPDIIKIYYK